MTYNTIIIGGGIIGCSTAFYLSRRGHKVLLLEQGRIAKGTTSNSFAWANATSKTNDQTYHDLNAIGQRGYYTLAKEFGPDKIGINPVGALHLANKNDVANWQETQDMAQALTAFGYENEWLDSAGLQALEPNLNFAPKTEALFTPTDICVNALHFTRFLATQTTAAGGTIMENCKALELLALDDGTVTGVRTDKGVFTANNVVVATGQNTPQTLANLTGYDGFNSGFPLARPPGLLLVTPPLDDELRPNRIVLTSRSSELHILPEFNGGIKIASDDIDGHIIDDQSPENLAQNGQLLLNRAQALIPKLFDHVSIKDCKLSIGVRPYPTDGKTIAGPMPDAQGLYVIVTHSGITLAPAIGTLMAEMLITGKTPDRLTPFGIERFSGFGGSV